MRARGEPAKREDQTASAASSASAAWLEVGAFDLWREEAGGLRNLGTGALINFRGDAVGGEGGAVRAHGDTKPRRAARLHTPRTRFVLERVASRPRSGVLGL